METNLYGCAYPVRHALKYMKKSDTSKKGHILVLSSYSGVFGVPGRSSYCASKFAVNGFFESLRMELGDQIDITLACPTTVLTNFRDNSLIKPEQNAADAAHGSTMTVEEAINAIIEAADYRLDRFIFPLKTYMSIPLHVLFPKTIEKVIKNKASLSIPS